MTRTGLELDATLRADGTTVLTAVGEIDATNADRFSSAIATAAAAGAVIVDLTAVQYLDSAGLVPLFANADQVELVIPPLLEPVITVSGLGTLTTVRLG
ncbi:STAS domain-containing protein [Kribbella sp. NPDC051587]|uniref:STAS domain-containing protein n=1 Tax=Kribbella sp. NPDC051587 TaxID=3364119 RepID=UPI00379B8376